MIAVFGSFSIAFTGQVKASVIQDILHRCESGRSSRHARNLVKRSGWSIGAGSMASEKGAQKWREMRSGWVLLLSPPETAIMISWRRRHGHVNRYEEIPL